nr:hypothetical protein [Tanacetum cinerariifolium]
MNLLNGTCYHWIYGDGKPITCNECEGMLSGGFCLPCNLKDENSFICYQNAYSFDDTSNNSNYIPQPRYENYLCNLCENNSHDGYDCQQQFPLVYEQEPSYNQNCNDNYHPHKSPSFPCYNNCEESHETFECQPMDQNIDFSGSDQIQTPQYLEIHPPSQEISDEVFQVNHSVQYKEYSEYSSNEIAASNSNQEEEGPPQDFDIRQLIREECCVEVNVEQKQNMEDTILDALNSKLLSINSQHLNKEKQEVKNVMEQLAEQPEYSPSMGYENSNTTPKTESDEIIKSGVEELVPNLKSHVESNFVESLSNHDALINSSQKIDYLEEFSGELAHINPKITESNFDFEEEIRLIENLLYDNSFPRLPKELNAEIANTIVEPFPSLPIPDIHFLEELHSDNSIPLTEDESSDSDHKEDPSVLRPPPEPPDADFEPDSREEISVVMNTIDELECVNPKDEFDDDNYSSFMFLIYPKMFSFLLSAESEDTIYDPSISV